MSKAALWLTRHWPVSTNYRLSLVVYLWLIGIGSKAFVAELYPDGIPPRSFGDSAEVTPDP